MRFLKKILLLSALIISIIGCSNNKKKEYKWIYKTIKFFPIDTLNRTGKDSFKASTIDIDEYKLNELGNENWELVTSYLESETAYPNFGESKYITGIRENSRPQVLVLIFKKKVEKIKLKKWKLVVAFSSGDSATGDFSYYTNEIEKGCKETKSYFKWVDLDSSEIVIKKDNINVDVKTFIEKYSYGWLLIENGKKPVFINYDPGNVDRAVKFCKNK